ncbi:putative fidgetin-like protein 2 [Apteryx rowi]|uniref:putative fidgetin-like protein 2 n=1 Tax=Apteryx rowi TaxID=308060 RepID=UPI000E1CB25C|nr:putative fidgetin-like protein 2 [Apteryx rowi]
MHWSPEHAQSLNQWPEQHLDVSSTTSSPAHKPDLYPSGRQRFNYAWANDDISALTASNLLKRYAEKYSGVLEPPYERPALSGYGDGAFGALNGQKGDGEPWAAPPGPEGAYALTPAPYGYQSPGLAPPPPVPPPVPDASLKRKAFDMAGGPEEGEGRYGKFGYEPPKPAPASPYGNGFGAAAAAEPPQGPFKAGKRPAAEERPGKYGGPAPKGLAAAFGAGEPAGRAATAAAEPFEKFSPPAANGERAGEPGRPFPPRRPPKAPAFGVPPAAEPPDAVDPLALELVDSKMVDGGPPVQWADIAGQVSVKAAIEEELVWPILRPGAYSGAGRPPRTILLFGPRGTGKTLLSRCISTQLGSSLLKLSGAALLSKWKAEAEKILQTVFFVASCRQPSVVLITEAESLLSARAGEDGGQAGNLKSQLLSYLDNVATSAEHNVVVIGTTCRPGAMDEAAHRRFAKRFYIPPPDGVARRQILHCALAQQNSCLSEREMASLVQHTESYSGGELIRLCQQAGAATPRALPGQLQPTSYEDFESAFCKVRPAASPKELDLFAEWDKMYGSRH